MDRIFDQIKAGIYDKGGFVITNYEGELESQEYEAARFDLSGLRVLSRTAKITPKKLGQFVTLWKRSEGGAIEPYSELDKFEYCIVNVSGAGNLGQFVFPKATLMDKGILSNKAKDGKRAFRVYPSWDVPMSKQAEQTQKWQLQYFYEFRTAKDIDKLTSLLKL